MNALEHQLDYPFADTLPAAGDVRGRARRALAAHAVAVLARSHQPLAAARRDRRAGRLDDRRLRDRVGCDPHALGADLRHASRRPARAARARHALPPRSLRPRELAVRRRRQGPLERAVVDDARRVHVRLPDGGRQRSNAGGAAAADHSRAMATDPAALDKLRNRRNYSDLVPAVPPLSAPARR